MQLMYGKLPQEGDEPTGEGDLPHLVLTQLDKDGDSTMLKHSTNLNSEVSSHYSVNNNTAATTTTTTSSSNSSSSSSTPSRTHVLRTSSSSSRKLLHRCPFGNCCKENRSSGQYSRSAYRNNNNNNNGSSSSSSSCSSSSSTTTATAAAATTHLNIPFDHPEDKALPKTANTVPNPSCLRVPSGAPGRPYYYYYINHHLYNQSFTNDNQQDLHHPLLPSDHQNAAAFQAAANTRKDLLVRGPQATSSPVDEQHQPNPHHLQQQQQQQLQYLRVPPYYRKRAINFMMAHLQLRVSENDEALEAVRKRIERIEDQVYNSSHTKEDYLSHLAIKLGAIMDKLYSCHTTRHSSSHHHTQSRSNTHTHHQQQQQQQQQQQSACV